VKKHRNVGTIAARQEGPVYIVSLPWQGQNKFWWNEACANVIEVFGLPGDRFITDIINGNNKDFPKGATFMEWIFREEHDAILFRLKFGEVCV